MGHLDRELIADLVGDLEPAERARVEAHLARCAACRAERDGLAEILAALRSSPPPTPELLWSHWNAELRARLGAARRRAWWRRPWPVLMAGGLAAALLAAVWAGFEPSGGRPDPRTLEEVTLGRRLELLRHYPVLERLDLLEDMELIGQLDRLEARGGG
jgi:anti-sigma factor RsiW